MIQILIHFFSIFYFEVSLTYILNSTIKNEAIQNYNLPHVIKTDNHYLKMNFIL